MTKDQRDYIEKQLHIIQVKKDEVALNRYVSLLRAAELTEEVKEYLCRACDVRRDELAGKPPALVVTSDFK